ncbi:MAG: anti-sigma factor antagonist [Candidatus Krumholzibacteria bacterium]|nr:anti-sigma factor antagonist [Candidatus Krumholzibacteria bacterium]
MIENILKEKTEFQLEIPADENNLSEVRDFIADICMRAGFTKRETNNTKLAMDEACTNIIKHAYKDIDGDIKIEVFAEPGRVDINVFDRGKAFEWSDIKDPDLERYVEIGKKGGLGIYLMNRLMDDLDYKSSEQGNRLFMSKSSEGALGMSQWPLFSSLKLRWTSTLRFKFAFRAGMGLFSLVLFLWIVQFVNQGREIESQERQAWLGVSNLARGLVSKSEKAMILDDLYDPEYREINDYIQDRIVKLPEITYVRIINNDDLIVSSSVMEEFNQTYDMADDRAAIPNDGIWFSVTGTGVEDVEEFHYPVMLFNEATDHPVNLGRIILGVSRQVIEGNIHDPRPRTTLILAGILLVGLALVYLLISVFIKPIQDLTDGVRAIGEGALEDGIHIDGPEEIGAIASAFNEITARFRDAQKNVVEQERMQKEMQVAQEIQHSLLPGKVPDIKGYDISSLYRAAKEVGGDYYDFVNVGEDSLGIVVADVSGKGVPGSLVMTMIRTALRMEARGSLSAAEVMSRMNDFVTDDMKKGMFVTIFYLILDSKNRIISYASAGHNPMILFRAETDETFFLNPRGFPVGISLPDDTLFRRSIDVEKIKLKKDDMLLIYTDGVTEAMNGDREQYGEDRLIKLIKENGKYSPDKFMDLLNEDIKEFTGDFPQNDDITVVAIKEKMMADDVLYGIRKKLLDLVDIEGLTVAEACTRMKVSPSTYYRYKKRLAEMGERGLKNKTLREEHEIRRVSTEQRKTLLEIIRANPRYGAKRIATLFSEGRDGKNILSSSLVYEELKRMRLNTYEKRLEYLRRNRFVSEEQYQALLSGGQYGDKPVSTEEESGRVGEPQTIGEGTVGEETILSEVDAHQTDDLVVSGPGEQDESVVEGIPEESVAAGKKSPAMSSQLPSSVDDGDERGDIEKILSDILAPDESGGTVVGIELEEYRDGITVFRVTGHLDSSSASDLENVIENVFEYGCRKIVVDLAEVSYISSGGWGIFTGRVKVLRDSKGDVVLAGMSPEVFDIYDLLGFQDIIMHCQSIDEAVDFISLPFDERQKKLHEGTRVAGDSTEVELIVSSMGLDSGKEETSPWTPLTVEAGTVGEAGEITVLNLNGVIDTVSCLKLKGIMSELISNGAYKLLVDMSRVEYVSSAGWGVFASRIDDLRGWGGDIKVFGMDPEVDSIFHLLGFDVIMRSFSIMAEAIEDFSVPVGSWMEAGPAIPEMAENSSKPADHSLDHSGVEGIETTLRVKISRKESPEGDSTILALGGAIDAATTSEFEDYLERSVSEDSKYFIIDLSEVIYISSSGWGVIIKYMQRITGRAGKIALCGMTPAIFKIFRDLGFEPLVPNYIDVEKAIAELYAPDIDDHGDDTEQHEVVQGLESLEQPGTGIVNEVAGHDASADLRESGRTGGPEVGSPAVSALQLGHEEKMEELEVELDLENGSNKTKDKDRSIRSMGWKEYGRKLSRRNKKKKKD